MTARLWQPSREAATQRESSEEALPPTFSRKYSLKTSFYMSNNVNFHHYDIFYKRFKIVIFLINPTLHTRWLIYTVYLNGLNPTIMALIALCNLLLASLLL